MVIGYVLFEQQNLLMCEVVQIWHAEIFNIYSIMVWCVVCYSCCPSMDPTVPKCHWQK